MCIAVRAAVVRRNRAYRGKAKTEKWFGQDLLTRKGRSVRQSARDMSVLANHLVVWTRETLGISLKGVLTLESFLGDGCQR